MPLVLGQELTLDFELKQLGLKLLRFELHLRGIHERGFAELPSAPPEARELSPAYAVRVDGGPDVMVGGSIEEFHATLRDSFPECAEAAVRFYREAAEVAGALRRAALRTPALAEASRLQLVRPEKLPALSVHSHCVRLSV